MDDEPIWPASRMDWYNRAFFWIGVVTGFGVGLVFGGLALMAFASAG